MDSPRARREPGEVAGDWLPLDLAFRNKGQLAIDICADCRADGLEFDFICGDEVYGGCTQLREFLEAGSQAYVLRASSSFMVTLATGTKVTCKDAVKLLVKDKPEPGGSTSAPDSPATPRSPWSASEMRLPY